MRSKVPAVMMVVLFMTLFVAVGYGAQKEAKATAFFPETSYEFSAVLDGAKVIHEFVIQNKGTETLKVERVKTGWGCTAVSYSREIPAGGEGKITLSVDTKGYGGKQMKKTAGVYTNDKNLSQQDLVIFGQVENFVTLRPKHVILRGVAGEPIESMVTIIPEKKYPFKIIDAKAQNGENIKIELKEIAKSNGSVYELKVENLKATTGRYYDTIILKTDSSVQPELNVRVYGYVASSEALSEQPPLQEPEGRRSPP